MENKVNPYYVNLNPEAGNVKGSISFADAMWNTEKNKRKNINRNIKLAKERGCVCGISPNGWVKRQDQEFILHKPYFITKDLEIGDKVAMEWMLNKNPKYSDIEIISIYDSLLSLRYYKYKKLK